MAINHPGVSGGVEGGGAGPVYTLSQHGRQLSAGFYLFGNVFSAGMPVLSQLGRFSLRE